jgi:hypothetical protein
LIHPCIHAGFNDQEIVALSGAHALGRCHAENSGYVGPWQGTPTIFSNIYYKLLLKVNWTPDERAAKFQFKDPSGSLMMLPSDLVLTQDAEFKKHVEAYAKDKKARAKREREGAERSARDACARCVMCWRADTCVCARSCFIPILRRRFRSWRSWAPLAWPPRREARAATEGGAL